MVLSEKSKVCNGMIISHLKSMGDAVPPDTDVTAMEGDDNNMTI